MKVGDIVLVLAILCGVDWAKETYPTSWRSEKISGTVTGRAGSKWTVAFDDDFSVNLNRADITFKRRPGGIGGGTSTDPAPAAAAAADDDSDDSDSKEEAVEAVDSSDEEAEEPEEEIEGDDDGETPETVEGWTEDDDVSMGQRALDEKFGRGQPKYNLPNYESKELFDYALHCLPMDEVAAMAAA